MTRPWRQLWGPFVVLLTDSFCVRFHAAANGDLDLGPPQNESDVAVVVDGSCEQAPGTGATRNGARLLQRRVFTSAQAADNAGAGALPARGDVPKVCFHPPTLDANGDVLSGAGPYVQINLPCPAACPFNQPLEESRCLKACVAAEYCKALHPFRIFPDNSTLECSAPCGFQHQNTLLGCRECAAPGICKRCSFWGSLSDDGKECKDNWKLIWHVIYYLFSATICSFLLYLAYLIIRPTVSPTLLQKAKEHRRLCMPWVLERGAGWQRFPLTTRTDKRDVNSIGAVLYFRWMHFMLLVSVMLTLIFCIAFHVPVEEIWWQGDFSNVRYPGKVLGVDLEIQEKEDCSSTTPIMSQWSASDEHALASWPGDHHGSLSIQWPVFTQESEGQGKPKVRSMKKVKVKLKPKVKPKVRPKTKQGGNDAEWELPAGDEDEFPKRMTVFCVIAYVIISILSLEFGRRQKDFANRWAETHKTHQEYTVVVSGLPQDATNEIELRRFFQEQLDAAVADDERAEKARVVGISVAFDFLPQINLVSRAISHIFQKLSDDFDASERALGIMSDDSDPSDVTLEGLEAPRGCLELPGISHVDHVFFKPDASQPDWEEETQEALREIPCSGYAYLVVSSQYAKRKLMDFSMAEGEQLSFKGSTIKLEENVSQPQTVSWSNFSAHITNGRIAKNFGLIIAMMVLWAIFYIPYATYSMSAVAAEQEIEERQATVLGLFIAVGNTLVAIVIEQAVSGFGIFEKDRSDAFTMVLIFIAMVANTAVDIIIVFFVIQHMSKDMAVHGTLDNTHYDRVLSQELYALIAPGYLITPYIMAPFFEDILPYILGRSLIRSSRGASQRQAETKLMACEFDITWRYSDLLTNFTICLSLIMFETKAMYEIMVWLVLANILVYVLDHYRSLRSTSHTLHVTEHLSMTFSYWWAVPTGFLGSIAVHWCIEAHWIYGRAFTWPLMISFMGLHCALYSLALWWLRNTVEPSQEKNLDYDEMCAERLREEVDVSTYFNANPVHVLRTWLLTEGLEASDCHCIPYAQGKEHLQILAGRDHSGSAHLDTASAIDPSSPLLLSLLGRVRHVRKQMAGVGRRWWSFWE